MTTHAHLLVPGPIHQRTGGYIYDRRMIAEMAELGICMAVHGLPATNQLAPGPAGIAAAACLAALPDDALVIIDGLAMPAVVGSLSREARRLRLVALIHHPLALETGLPTADAVALAQMEAFALTHMRRIIVTSRHTAAVLADRFGVPQDRIATVIPGTDPAPMAAGSGERAPVLLTVGSLTARKGYLVLLEALAKLCHMPWRLVAAGSGTLDPQTATAIHGRAMASDLAGRVQFFDELPLSQLEPLFAQADLFVLASYYEGFGMAAAEALARGLPMVTTTGGALADTVPDTAALKVPPGNVAALAQAIGQMLVDEPARTRLKRRARRAGRALPPWPAQARAFIGELARVPAAQ